MERVDLVVRRARRPDGWVQDIAISDGLITAMGDSLHVQGTHELEADGNLRTPTFIWTPP